jgi:hypothetical protein
MTQKAVLKLHFKGNIKQLSTVTAILCPAGPLGSLSMTAELQNIAEFAVDADDLKVIREEATQQDPDTAAAAAAAAAAAEGARPEPRNLPSATAAAGGGIHGGSNETSAAAVAAGSPFANGMPAAVAADARAAATLQSLDGLAMASMLSMVSCADISAGEFTYAAWAQEMADMKVRRWKSLMPVLSPKSELTTREMVSESDTLFGLIGGGGGGGGGGGDRGGGGQRRTHSPVPSAARCPQRVCFLGKVGAADGLRESKALEESCACAFTKEWTDNT